MTESRLKYVICSFSRPVRSANIDAKKSEANAPLVLLKMNRFISGPL